jgi:hypothetical protein
MEPIPRNCSLIVVHALAAADYSLGSPTFETPALKQVHCLPQYGPFEHRLKANDFILQSPTFGTRPEQPPTAAPASPPVERWRRPPPQRRIKAAARAAARTFQPADPPIFPEWKTALEEKLAGPVTREIARDALRRFAPQLLRKRGQKRSRRT